MKNGIFIISILIFRQISFAQNVGINNPDPKATLDVTGSIRVQSPVSFSSATPTPAQTFPMNNSPSLDFVTSDSVFRILDPGGSGPYINNVQGNNYISVTLGCKLNFNPSDFGIGNGDTLWISKDSYPGCRNNYLHRYFNTTTPPNELLINGGFFIIFRSNGDGNNGPGFDMKVTRLYDVTNTNAPMNAVGNAFYFDNKTGALRAGFMGTGAVGSHSIGLGLSTVASGFTGATALGYLTSAIGDYGATAMGNQTIASGDYGATSQGYFTSARGNNGATALGYLTLASGSNGATALGYNTEANGNLGGTALGMFTIASGNNGATAFGHYTNASGHIGATALGSQTIASSAASLATGRYNDTIAGSSKTSWVATDPLLTVGNGTSNAARSNAMTVYKNGNTDLNGYVRLGKITDDAPRIKVKKLTGNSPAVDGFNTYPHFVDAAKIIGVEIFMQYGASPTATKVIPPGYTLTGNHHYQYEIDGANIRIQNIVGQSGQIGGKPLKIMIIYEE